MDDLISRQDAIEAFDKQYWKQINIPISKEIRKAAQDTIRELPPAQTRKKGRWLAIGNTGLAACECGFITDRYRKYKFCPNCGNPMDGAEMERSDDALR